MDQKISALSSNVSITGAEELPVAKGAANFKESFANLSNWIAGFITQIFDSTLIYAKDITASSKPEFLFENGGGGSGTINLDVANVPIGKMVFAANQSGGMVINGPAGFHIISAGAPAHAVILGGGENAILIKVSATDWLLIYKAVA